MPGDLALVHYQLRLEDERVIGSSFGSEPLRFTIGLRQHPFELFVIGMRESESRSIAFPAHELLGNAMTGQVILTLQLVKLHRHA
jgi:FKBP-type peptidyl-prolyl cis-trans isomerase 2